MKVNCSLDVASLRKAEEAIRKYAQSLNDKNEEFLNVAAETLRKDAQQGFSNAITDVLTEASGGGMDYGSDVMVGVLGGKANEKIVVASGSQTAFIEFGAGVYFNGAVGSKPHIKADKVGAVGIGEYGKGYGAQEKWRIGRNVWTHGTPMQAPMWLATINLESELLEIARSIFKT